MEKILKKFSVTTQVLFLLTILIFPLNCISLVYAVRERNSFIRQAGYTEVHVLELFMKELDEHMEIADRFMFEDSSNSIRVAKLRRTEERKEYTADAAIYWQELMERARNRQGADGYFFYLAGEDYGNVAVNSSISTKDRWAILDYVKKFVKEPADKSKNWKWKIVNIKGKDWVVHTSKMKDDYFYGSVIDLDAVLSEIKENIPDYGREIWIDETALTEEETLFSVKSENSMVQFHLRLRREQVLDEIPVLIKSGLLLSIGYLFCIPVILLATRYILIIPMQRFINAMRILKRGEQDYRISEKGANRETDEIYQEFNSMADRLKELKIQVYEEELMRIDIEATNLRLQVNPHFILNCLNIIFSLTSSKNGDNVRHIKIFTKYLAEYLRFSLWHISGTVLIKEELRCVKNYIEIQKIRFPGKFTYIENIDEKNMGEQLPSLLILNFVENAIKHGMNMEGEIEIIVSVRKEDDQLWISICDTGNGMSEEILQSLREGKAIEDDAGKHIGIWNCRRRMNMMYQEKAYFSVTSEPGKGTQIFLGIPAEVQYESIDR